MEKQPINMESQERPIEESWSTRKLNKLKDEITTKIRQLTAQIDALNERNATQHSVEFLELTTEVYTLTSDLEFVEQILITRAVAKELKEDSFERVSELTDPYMDINSGESLVVDGDIRSWHAPDGEQVATDLDLDPITAERDYN